MTIEAVADTVADIAKDFTDLLKAGKFDEAGETYWADSVVSIEPFGEGAVTRGIAAVRIKGENWSHDHEVHGVEVSARTSPATSSWSASGWRRPRSPPASG